MLQLHDMSNVTEATFILSNVAVTRYFVSIVTVNVTLKVMLQSHVM